MAAEVELESVRSAQKRLSDLIDDMKPSQRLDYLFFRSSDNALYWLGVFFGLFTSVEWLISPAHAQDGFLSVLGQGKNYIATLIFIAFLVSLVGAIFAKGPGRTASETFAKLLAGGLVGFVGGAKA
jgi:hypothetical protein